MVKHILIVGIVIICWVGVIITNGIGLTNWINISFLVGLIGLVVAATFQVLHSGFLAIFLKGFRTVGTMISPRSHAQERADLLMSENEDFKIFKKKLNKTIIKTALSIGVASLTVSIVGVVIFY